jgi:ribosomal subunit interface protein
MAIGLYIRLEVLTVFPSQLHCIEAEKVEVIIDGEPNGKTSVEVIARGEHRKIFVVTETSEDIYRCIDSAVHKLERQLRRKKSKERDNKHAGKKKSV